MRGETGKPRSVWTGSPAKGTRRRSTRLSKRRRAACGSRRFFENWVETLDDHTELNRRTISSLQELAREQREVFRELSRESVDAYGGFLDSLDAYQEDISNLQERDD